MTFAAAAMIWGLTTMSPIDVKVLKERAPLYAQMSDGTIQNKYTVKIVNKGESLMRAEVSVKGQDDLVYIADRVADVEPGNVASITLFIRIPRSSLTSESTPVDIFVQDLNNPAISDTYTSVFHSPKR